MLIVAIFLLGTYVVSPLGLKRVISAPLDRILDPKNDDISGGRVQIWNEYLKAFKSDFFYLLFGKSSDKARVHDFDYVAHNMILETITGFGLIGLFLYVLLFYAFYRSFRSPPMFVASKYNWFHYLPLFVIILAGMTGHTFVNMGTVWVFCLWIIVLTTLKKQKHYYANSMVNGDAR